MDIAAVRTALRAEAPVEMATPPSVHAALLALAAAVERKARADAEAAISRRPSTMKATLKTTMAVERARQHVLAELRLVTGLTAARQESVRLRLCG